MNRLGVHKYIFVQFHTSVRRKVICSCVVMQAYSDICVLVYTLSPFLFLYHIRPINCGPRYSYIIYHVPQCRLLLSLFYCLLWFKYNIKLILKCILIIKEICFALLLVALYDALSTYFQLLKIYSILSSRPILQSTVF